MDDSFSLKEEQDEQNNKLNSPKENGKAKIPKAKRKFSSPKGSKDPESFSKKFDLIDGIKQSKDDTDLKNNYMRKESMPIELRKTEAKRLK